MPTKAYPVVKQDGQYVALVEDEPKPAAEVKPGKKTTEGLATIAGAVFAILAAKGYITPDNASAASAASTEMIGTAGAVLVPSIYAVCRTALKIVQMLKG